MTCINKRSSHVTQLGQVTLILSSLYFLPYFVVKGLQAKPSILTWSFGR